MEKRLLPARLYTGTAILSLVMALAGCSANNNGSTPSMASYRVSVENLTNGQPMTPLAVVLHDESYRPWTEGMPASTGLEMLAEGGGTTGFLMEADSHAGVLVSAATTAGPFLPGGSESITLDVTKQNSLYLSIATMLANSNDAFTGLSAMDISGMAVGEIRDVFANALDAGTEANSEATGSIPGPADGGEGFNMVRETRNVVVGHPGVVTGDDGLSTSVLTEAHRWLNPVARIVIERIQ